MPQQARAQVCGFADIKRLHEEAEPAADEDINAADALGRQALLGQNALETIAAAAFAAPGMRSEEEHGASPKLTATLGREL